MVLRVCIQNLLIDPIVKRVTLDPNRQMRLFKERPLRSSGNGHGMSRGMTSLTLIHIIVSIVNEKMVEVVGEHAELRKSNRLIMPYMMMHYCSFQILHPSIHPSSQIRIEINSESGNKCH